jgi:hypothetical protein
MTSVGGVFTVPTALPDDPATLQLILRLPPARNVGKTSCVT